MRVIPVIDLLGGVVVRGVAGERSRYRPVQGILAEDARPATVARALVERLGCREAYVADLDAIAGREPQWEVLLEVAAAGLTLLLDAGVGAPSRAHQLAVFARRHPVLNGVVVGLESVADPHVLAAVHDALDPDGAMFSLDLKDGQPFTEAPAWKGLKPMDIADVAVRIGFRQVLVLDLACVGRGQGPGVETLCRTLHARHPDIELIAGGGVRGVEDLRRLRAAGCSAALVASRLHDGRLTRQDLETA